MRKIIIIAWLSMMALGVQAEQAKSTASMEKDTILIGDQLNLQLEVLSNKNTKVSWPNLSEHFKEGVELVKLFPIDTLNLEGDKISYQQKMLVTSFDTGFYEINAFNFACVDQTDTSFYKSISNPLFLRVNTMTVDTTQVFKPIKGPIQQGYTFTEALPLIGGVLLITVIGLLLYYFFFRKKDEPLFTARRKETVPPHVQALNDLDQLKGKKLWQEGKTKAYYTELTDIFRIYLDGRFEIDAMEMTSDEIREKLEKVKEIDKKSFAKISETLATADLVKFAKMQPLPEENEKGLENIKGFVEETAKKAEEEEAEKSSFAKASEDKNKSSDIEQNKLSKETESKSGDKND